MLYKIQAPSTRIPFCLKTEIFFSSALAYRPHVSDENGQRKRIFSKTSVEIFENAGFSFTIGRKKTEVFEYDDVIYHILLALRMLRKGCYRISIVVAFDVDRRKIFAYATCGRRKTSSFSKKSGYVQTKPQRGANKVYYA